MGESAREEARVEVEAGAEEETSQGGLEVSAAGNVILKENPTLEFLQNKKQIGTPGGMEGGQPRGEQGYWSREMGGKMNWDPGPGKERQDTG